MKRLHVLVVLGFACALTVNAQKDPDGGGVRMTQGLDPLYAHLELNTDLIQLRHCSDERRRLSLRLNYTNRGQNVVILDKRSSAITQYLISRSLKNAMKKKCEINVPILISLDGAGMTMESVPDESNFVVLKPGEVYSLVKVFSFYGSSLRGLNFLQMVVLTWYYPRASNFEWRNHWKTKGYLWTDPITSTPMPFEVENKASVVDCL